jgi:hypothetical protein
VSWRPGAARGPEPGQRHGGPVLAGPMIACCLSFRPYRAAPGPGGAAERARDAARRHPATCEPGRSPSPAAADRDLAGEHAPQPSKPSSAELANTGQSKPPHGGSSGTGTFPRGPAAPALAARGICGRFPREANPDGRCPHARAPSPPRGRHQSPRRPAGCRTRIRGRSSNPACRYCRSPLQRPAPTSTLPEAIHRELPPACRCPRGWPARGARVDGIRLPARYDRATGGLRSVCCPGGSGVA